MKVKSIALVLQGQYFQKEENYAVDYAGSWAVF